MLTTKAFFLMRLNDHIQYLKNIEKRLTGENDFAGSSHRECKLGKWLYGEGILEIAGLKNPKAQEIFESLFEPHQHFHEASAQAIEKYQAGDTQGAHQAITDMHVFSRIITQKLLQLDAMS